MHITGIILAGGKSLRMGTDKALLEINGQPLLQRAIDYCRPWCQTILVSSNDQEHKMFGCETVPDEIQNCGPLGGIYSCLQKSETDWNFVLSTDAPFVEPAFFSFLVSASGNYDVVVPCHNGGVEPLIALYHKRCSPEIAKCLKTGHFKMQDFFKTVNTCFIGSQSWVDQYPRIFFNLNRPEDFLAIGSERK